MALTDFVPEQSEVSTKVTEVNTPLPEQPVPEAVEATPTSEVFATAFEQHNPITNLFQLGQEQYEPLEQWDASAFPELLQDVPEEFRNEVSSARSLEHAERIKREIKAEEEGHRLLTDSGYTGIGAMVVATLASPDIVIGGGSIIKSGQLVTKGLRLKQAAYAGLEGAAVGAISESTVAMNRHTVDAEDVMYNALAGMALVGGADVLMNAKGLAAQSGDVIGKTQREMNQNLSVGAAQVDQRNTRFSQTEAEADIVAESREWQAEHKVSRGGKVSEVMDALTGWFPSKLKTDSTNLWESKSAVANKFTHEMAESGSGIYGRTDTAAQLKDITERRYLTKIMPNYEGHVQQFSGSKQVKGRKAKADVFNTALREELELRRRAHIDGTQPVPNTDPVITKAADEWQAMMDDVLNDGKASGIKGFEDIERIPGYVPLHWDGHALRNMSKTDYNGYVSLLSEGYESVGMDEETALKIAEAVLDRTGRKDLKLDSNVSSLFSGDAANTLKQLLGDDAFEKVAAIVKGKAEDAGKSARVRSRTDVDLTVTDASGRSLMAIVNNDMQFIGSKYAQEMAGRVALAKKGVKSEADFERIKEAALKEASELGEDTEVIGNSMQSVYNQLLSRPADGVGVNKGARRFMDFASVSMLGGMGMAQLAEYGPILAQAGLQDTLKNLQTLNPKNFIKDFNGDLLTDMESFMGKIGQEEILYSPYVRLEDADDAVTNALLQRYDDVSARAQHLNGILSGNNAIKRHQQRMAVTLGSSKVIRLAKEGKLDKQFLNEIGIKDSTMKEINKRLSSGDIEFNERGALEALNLRNWNPEAAENFSVAMNRHMHQVVQRTLAGEDSYWMSGTFAKMMLQFRNYPIAAMGKQLARGVRSGNAGPVFLYSTATAALAYNIKLTVQNKDTSDLTTEDHIQGIMQMSSPAGLLPDMYSTTLSMMGQDTTFGRQADVSNPVFSMVGSAAQAPSAMYNLASGEGTKSDVSVVSAVTPFSNIAGVSALVNGLKEGL